MLPAIPAPLSPQATLPVALCDPQLDTPALIVDLEIVERNLRRWSAMSRSSGVALRPHVKTHKSVTMARRQLAAGAVGVTASGTTEAEAMIDGGIADVTIAYPIVGARKLRRLGDLLPLAQTLTLVADSEAVLDGYRQLAGELDRVLRVLVEVDTGMHRIGLGEDAALRLAASIAEDPRLHLAGILTHAGHAHDAGKEGVRDVARDEARAMGRLARRLADAGIAPEVVSAGSTLTAPFVTAADGITEIRPGTYVYNDLRTLTVGACEQDSLAATILTTVISTDGERRVTVDAGNKTLTATVDAAFGYGVVLGCTPVRVARASEEHGVLEYPAGARLPGVGERLRILPIHVCPCVDIQPEVYGTRNGEIVERIAVDAMRHSL